MRSLDNSPDLFEELGLAVTHGEVQIGETYPIFGMITSVEETGGEQVRLVINYNITAYIQLDDAEKLAIIKQRAFESGIFFSRVVAKEPHVEVECSKIVFGKSQASHC